MPVIPGHDFSYRETVTPDRLLQWLVGAAVYPAGSIPAAGSGLSVGDVAVRGSGASIAEGGLIWNTSTGNVEIGTRWGTMPVLAGSALYTKRFKRWWGSSAAGRKYYSAMMLGHPGGGSTVSLGNPLLLNTQWETYSVVRTCSRNNSPGTSNMVWSPAVLHPSADQPGVGSGSEASFTDLVQRLMCLRGWTPVWGTYASNATSVFISITNDRVGFGPLSGEQDQSLVTRRAIMRLPYPWFAHQTANVNYTFVGYAYVLGAWGVYQTDTDVTHNCEV